ncbi:hypothetical protein BD410DRAFT_828858 [Rickenella mellea]|uniref:Protein kinase domain-containing protein n=1 Tax=Rickenella mellea TaxID=50990 RepID=A0A4Y7Q3M4_9AGAM|nr:hypothetical protein BD410DRAFT_828858 [Rickenella mellea]
MNVPIYIDILRTKEVPELQVAVSGIDFSNTNSVVIVQHPDDASVKQLLAERMCPWVNTFVLVNYYMYHAKVLKLEHPHISRIVGFARTTGGEPVLLFPHAEDLTLKDHVEKWSVSMTDRLKYMRDILSALIYMHSGRNGVKFAKGAFSESSILINSENKAYFPNWCSNFSEHTMSKVTIPPECMAKDCGPDEWFGDFGLESDRDVQCRGDMWYFGLILLRMTMGYEGWSEVVRLIKNRKRPDCPDNVDKWLWDLIVDGCLIPDVSRRIGDKYAMLLVDNLIKRGELAEWPRKLRRKSLFTTIGLWLGYAVGTAINVIARKCLWKYMLSRSIKNWPEECVVLVSRGEIDWCCLDLTLNNLSPKPLLPEIFAEVKQSGSLLVVLTPETNASYAQTNKKKRIRAPGDIENPNRRFRNNLTYQQLDTVGSRVLRGNSFVAVPFDDVHNLLGVCTVRDKRLSSPW